MNQKPLHYDGSIPFTYETTNETNLTEAYEMTDEVRKTLEQILIRLTKRNKLERICFLTETNPFKLLFSPYNETF